ncbi:MAG: hypothetical protein HY600_05460 [Candidatus Omnitrophica bacterium]|nr:hypothetical protein [Candidatus Omnitrophota bacterium]
MTPWVSKPMNLAKILRPYVGEWVALSADGQRVAGHGPSPEIAVRRAKRKGERDPILIGAPEKGWGGYIL